MKKSLFVLIVLALVFCFGSGVLADAAIYDYGTVRDCDYDVYVATVDGGVNLRVAPTTESEIICKIPDFVLLHITSESTNGKGWGFTSYNGHSGWVALSQVSQKFPIKSASYYVVVTGSSLHHREGPYTSYGSYGTIPYGTEVLVEGTYNGWGEVEYKGNYGWIALKYTVDADNFVWEEEVQGDVMPIDESEQMPVEEDAAVTSLEKAEGGNSMLSVILIGMIILVIVIAAVLIIVITARKK